MFLPIVIMLAVKSWQAFVRVHHERSDMSIRVFPQDHNAISHIKHIHAGQMHGYPETHYAFFSLAAFLSA